MFFLREALHFHNITRRNMSTSFSLSHSLETAISRLPDRTILTVILRLGLSLAALPPTEQL